ncbi:MAG: GNAT family N-acetyltransferase [Aliifodinibius sp.]|nr:GNAT family N-acetyltransferase [Fodinibius sp.]NIV11038.1 GNAT family N-acetyltransferase [Fodinibius sp.]NIY29513.1 GNAT family N-acetyltransferase [Fodinibius sp.]
MLGISLRLKNNLHYYGSKPLLATVENGSGIALIALMTPPYPLQIAGPDNDTVESVQFLASRLREDGWDIPSVMGEETIARAFEKCWNEIAGTGSREAMRERLYELRSVQPIQYPAGNLRQAKMGGLELAIKWGYSFHSDCFGDSRPRTHIENMTSNLIEEGNLYFWLNPEPVSMAAFTRPTMNGISISHVYTPPELRRKGYASAIVAKLSQKALDSGKKFCTLFTDSSNPTSNSIYQKIGYEPITDIIEIEFTEAKRLAL